MKRFVALLLFLVFVDDAPCAYSGQLGAPFGWVDDVFIKPTPIKLRLFDILFLGIVIFASKKKRAAAAAVVAPMRHVLWLVVATTVVWFLYGVAKGGDVRFASWQVYLVLSMILVAFGIASVFQTASDYRTLARWLIAAAAYRALMCWISYFTWARHVIGESGAFLTSHDDTVSWVVAILILIVDAIERRSGKVVLRNALLAAFFAGAIDFNSRRLAWVSLGMGLGVTYILFPQGPAKRRINRIALYLAPLLLVYVVVGWGRQSSIFLPLRSISSVSTQEDASTLARNAENLGLIATANSSSAALGTGWGRPYLYLTLKYDISASFELWRYMPHNSILGLLAFTGALGFAGFWLPIPTSVFFNARVARFTNDPRAKGVAIVGAAQMVVCANQLYGDMGIFDLKPMYVLATGYAIAMSLPATASVWKPRPRKMAVTARVVG